MKKLILALVVLSSLTGCGLKNMKLKDVPQVLEKAASIAVGPCLGKLQEAKATCESEIGPLIK